MKNKNMIISGCLLVLSILYTYLVRVVNVRVIGPMNTKVGFASINTWFNNMFSYNETIYKLSEILGYLVLGIAFIYFMIGLIELIKNMNFKKVDKDIIMLGVFYAVVILVYVFFEELIINYRPVMPEGNLEASYPSSHTVLALCVGISSLFVSRKYIPKKYILITDIITIVLSLGVLLLRTISGVHWLTDIIGGIIISSTLLMGFYTVYEPIIIKRKKKESKTE